MAQNGSLGGLLRACREQCGIVPEDLARQLKLEPELLAELEADRFEHFGSEEVLKTCLRDYAELVDLAPNAVLRLYQRQVRASLDGTIYAAVAPVPAPAAVPTAGGRSVAAGRRGKPRRRASAASVLFVLPLILLGVGFFWYQLAQPPVPTGPSAPESAGPASLELALVPPAGGQLRLAAVRDTQVWLALDGRPAQVYTVARGAAVRWQLQQQAQLRVEPQAVELWFNERPVPLAKAVEIRLLPLAPGGRP